MVKYGQKKMKTFGNLDMAAYVAELKVLYILHIWSCLFRGPSDLVAAKVRADQQFVSWHSAPVCSFCFSTRPTCDLPHCESRWVQTLFSNRSITFIVTNHDPQNKTCTGCGFVQIFQRSKAFKGYETLQKRTWSHDRCIGNRETVSLFARSAMCWIGGATAIYFLRCFWALLSLFLVFRRECIL